MSVVTDFTALFEQLQTDVATLQHQQMLLNQSVVSLTSKKSFIQGELDKIHEQIANTTSQHEASLAELMAVENAIAVAEQALQETTSSIARENTVLRAVEAAQAAKREEAAIALVEYEHAVEQLVDEEAATVDRISAERSKLAELQVNIEAAEAAKLTKLKQIASDITAKETELSKLQAQISTLTEQVSQTQALLANENSNVSAIKQQADDLEKAKTEFETYKQRANKSLQAKDDSLTERESILQTTRRRSGVLDNL